MMRQALGDAENANPPPPQVVAQQLIRTNEEVTDEETPLLLDGLQQEQQQHQEGRNTTRTNSNASRSRSRGSLLLLMESYGATTDRTTPATTGRTTSSSAVEETTTTTASQQRSGTTSLEGRTELLLQQQGSSSVQSFGSYNNGDDESFDDDDDEDDEEKSSDDDDDDDDERIIISIPERIWTTIKNLVRVVANVENLWDSPPPHATTATTSALSSSSSHRYPILPTQRRRNRQYAVVLFWFVVLASSYAGERSTFKLLVDRAGPFRLFSVQVITISHMILLGLGLLISYYMKLHRTHYHHRQHQYHYHRPAADLVDGPLFMPLGIPLVDCIVMAVLDTVTLVLVFLTGAHVPPTLTVILVQFTIPLTAFLTQLIHPDGKLQCCRRRMQSSSAAAAAAAAAATTGVPDNNNETEQGPMLGNGMGYRKSQYHDPVNASGNVPENGRAAPLPPPIERLRSTINDERLPGWGGLAAAHVWGSLILCLAVSLALCPAFYSIANPDFFIYADAIPTRTAINTIFFVLSCFPAAASQLYKEHIFLQYRQPVNMGYLNLILSSFQFILVSLIAPFAYGLQGLGFRGDWIKLYPPSGTSTNFMDGLKCFFGVLDDDDQENKYPEDAECDLTLLLALLYVFSIIAVGVSVDKIVNAGATKVMYRGISAGIIVAVLSMHYYDMHITDFSYGPAIDAINLVCLLLLVVGAEVYHRSSLQESTFETVYPEVLIPTFDD